MICYARVLKLLLLTGCIAAGTFFALTASADIGVVVDSDGSDPLDFDGLTITHGNILFDVPMAAAFGLDVDNAFAPLPAPSRFDHDFFDTLAKDVFLAAPIEEKEAVGIMISHGAFNNPTPGAVPQDIARMVFQIPLRAGGLPIGGPGQRWLGVKLGKPGAGGGPGGGGGGPKKGRKAAYLKPPKIPWGMSHWAAFIRSIKDNPGETEKQLRARVKAAIKVEKAKSSKKSLARYLKLVDDSNYMDPIENFVVELTNDDGRDFISIEFIMVAEFAAFSHHAALLDGVLIQITNDPALASTDPNAQPPGEELAAAGSVDVGAGDMVSIGLGDPEVPEHSRLVSIANLGLPPDTVQVTFFGTPIIEGDAATQYIAVGREGSLPDMLEYDQLVGDTTEDIALNFAEIVNQTPFRGGFPYTASASFNQITIVRTDGFPIEGATLLRTNGSTTMNELVETLNGGGPVVDPPIVPSLSPLARNLLLVGIAAISSLVYRSRVNRGNA